MGTYNLRINGINYICINRSNSLYRERVMLRDGKFIKEDPIHISAHYVPLFRERIFTPEERFTQDVLLGITPYSQSKISLFFSRLLSL